MDKRPRTKRSTRALKLKLYEPPTAALSTQAGAQPVFRLVDPPEEYDRDGDRMAAGALRLPPEETDVPLFWDHSHQDPFAASRLPVGRARIWWEDGEPLMSPVFDGVGELSKLCAEKVQAGTLRACSIGYLTLSACPNERGGEDVQEAELLEVSITGIPAKRSAQRLKSMATPEEVQQTFEQMAKDIAETKAMVAEVKELVAKLAPASEETKNEGGEEGEEEGDGAEGEDAVTKYFRGLVTKKK
ncbi:HK97 family phage prohead protease [Corallococcus exiguus]|uniref:HK97 family phage prohead protease n=1 Tax=Corallococcus exiguus TaxID=83462 RepID=UPI001A90223A|nr:HK97 family phage prohead protease [Corallococcus exiguus]MBN8466173.1 HK97 family phage prohead protease [Corallococcus exiguus]